MAAKESSAQLSGMGRRLVLDDLLKQEEAQRAQRDALKEKVSFISYLVTNNIVPADKIAFAASQEFGMSFIDLKSIEIDPETSKLVKHELVQKHHALPLFKRGQRLYLAISDPTNLLALDEIKFAVGMNTEAILVEENKLAKAIENPLESEHIDLGDIADLDDLDLVLNNESDDAEDDDTGVDDAPVVRFVNKVLLDAIKKGASDLHFEPYEKSFRIRFRVDGVLQEITKPPLALKRKIAARIKVMSRMDVSERRVPQDGRIKLKISKTKAIDFRVSTCPTLFGEKIVMRILDSDAASLQIDQLGYEDHQKEIFLKNLQKPYGMFLVTGPTGSGKTVSLYTGINILNRGNVNISTAEDPVEINLAGVNQVQIDERTGMTFEKALRAFLRQDPDIILVGEIRDLPTASIAIKAAQTGHMVMSTLHTNDAPQTLTRLQDMGIKPFAVASCINLITAQRLIRKLHPDYKKAVELPKEVLLDEGFTKKEIAAGITLFDAGDGGDDCPRGYKGRSGIYQVMPISEEMKRLIIKSSDSVQLADLALEEGIWDIRKSGLEKTKQGITSLTELNRITLE